jgi:hypothetical protein
MRDDPNFGALTDAPEVTIVTILHYDNGKGEELSSVVGAVPSDSADDDTPEQVARLQGLVKLLSNTMIELCMQVSNDLNGAYILSSSALYHTFVERVGEHMARREAKEGYEQAGKEVEEFIRELKGRR